MRSPPDTHGLKGIAKKHWQVATLPPTAAERRAAGQKESRYAKATEGIPIVVAVLGSWGRRNDALGDLLEQLARRASHVRSDSGLAAFGRRRRWLEEIAIAQFATATRADGDAHCTACTAQTLPTQPSAN